MSKNKLIKVVASDGKIFKSKKTGLLLTNEILLAPNDNVENYEEVEKELLDGKEE